MTSTGLSLSVVSELQGAELDSALDEVGLRLRSLRHSQALSQARLALMEEMLDSVRTPHDHHQTQSQRHPPRHYNDGKEVDGHDHDAADAFIAGNNLRTPQNRHEHFDDLCQLDWRSLVVDSDAAIMTKLADYYGLDIDADDGDGGDGAADTASFSDCPQISTSLAIDLVSPLRSLSPSPRFLSPMAACPRLSSAPPLDLDLDLQLKPNLNKDKDMAEAPST